MDQKGPSKIVLKKKKTDISLLKLTKGDAGIPRIPKTFVFDQNLPKEEYLKYINPENIIPESLEVATKVFSSYRKRIGGSGIEALHQDLPQILKHKSSLPFFDHNKSSAREIASYRDNAPSYEGSVMHDTKQVSMKKTMDKSRHDEIIQDATLDFKGMLKDIASFSASQDHRNEGYTDGQQTSPNRAKGSLRNGDDSINLSKIKKGTQEKEKEDVTVAGQSSGKENIKKGHQHKRSEGDIIHTMAKKKKKVTADQYEISDLDNTQEIVRKTDIAVRTLSKRSEMVKREMKNFEENVKTQLKESQSAPISSLRAVNLVRDYVFNEEEFAKLIEEEEMEEEREKAAKEYNQRNKRREKKKLNLKPTESKVKGFNNTMTARFIHIPFPKASPRNDAITITKDEMRKVEQVVDQQVAIKEGELKKQVEVQMRIHEKYGVFSNENNLFRINSMNYTKLMKEKEKIRDHLLQELKHTKYKERERESKMYTAQSHRVRSLHSDRPSRIDLDDDKGMGMGIGMGMEAIKKEDAKTIYINKIKEVLTKPVKDNIGNKPPELATHVNRLYGLRKKYTTTDIERVNQASYHNI